MSQRTVSSATGAHGRTGVVALLAKLRAYGKVLPRAKRNRTDLYRLLAKRPAVGMGVQAMEVGQLLSGRVDSGLKALAAIKAASRIGCPF